MNIKLIKSFTILTNSFFLNFSKFPLLFLLTMPVMLATPNIPMAEARCNSLWDCPALDPTDRRSPINPASIKETVNNTVNQTFKVSIKNNSRNTIWVAANAVVFPGGDFYTQGYWKLSPGETAYILDTPNRYIEFSAYDTNGTYWGDKKNQKKVLRDGKFRPFFQTDMGSRHNSFTQSFN